MEMIKALDVQRLIDKQFGYGQAMYDIPVLTSLGERDKGRHLVGRKFVYRMINRYIEQSFQKANGRIPATKHERNTIVRIEGENSGTRYRKDDILKMIAEPDISAKLAAYFEENTVMHEGLLMPAVVADYYKRHNIEPTTKAVNEDPSEIQFREDMQNQSTDELTVKLFIIAEELKRRKDDV